MPKPIYLEGTSRGALDSMTKQKIHRRLGVNIDHIATLREARKVLYPAPLEALEILKTCVVDQVTLHLREDRRHIQDHDLEAIISAKVLPVNFEMAVTDEMVGIALKCRPKTVTFVPEKREEITTEGGLDVAGQFERVSVCVKKLKDVGIHCSHFIDADLNQVYAAHESGADAIEIHTGTYCHLAECKKEFSREVEKIRLASQVAASKGLKVYAGHGLHVGNLTPITAISEIEEYNIGHAIIARAVFVGLEKAIREIQGQLNHR